jgi:hypothetical protein
MTCGRVDDSATLGQFLEVVKKALEERTSLNADEYCVYERDIRGYIVPRPNAGKVYACGAYATILRSYKLLVVPGAVVVYDVDLYGERCRVIRSYDAFVRLITRRPYYTVCIYDQPVDLTRALICAR